MNNKGQAQVGALILAFIAIIVALALLNGGIAGSVGTMTNTGKVVNGTIVFPTNLTCVTLTGQAVYPDASSANVIAINKTGNQVIGIGNYTINNKVNVNGELVAQLCGRPTVITSNYAGNNVDLTYQYEPFGYDSNSGNRAVIGLILIFVTLAVAVIALVPAVRSGVMDYFN